MTTTAIQVPAGWYPDPLATTIGGESTHRRWWDGAQWTEHVEPLRPTEVPRSPDVSTGAMRRARRSAGTSDHVAEPGAYTATGSAPVTLTPHDSARAAHRMSLHSTSADSAYFGSSASVSSAAFPSPAGSRRWPRTPVSAVDLDSARPRRRREPDRAVVSEPLEPRRRVYTTSVWLMATMPFTQALLIFAVFTSLPPESSAWTRGLTLVFPFILCAALAGQDARLMALAGHLRTAPWVSALLVPPVYLAVRSARIGRTTGAIAWPLYVWLLAQATVIGTWWAVDPAGVLAVIEPLL
ncbi:MAG: DUF2510 domain-containing protein [Microcella sp.]|uniref:DUF2510 domain-containing protein n=1 Tax=Microcella sp. TaxID=1913979 RepID=UPI0033146863